MSSTENFETEWDTNKDGRRKNTKTRKSCGHSRHDGNDDEEVRQVGVNQRLNNDCRTTFERCEGFNGIC